MSQVSSPPTPPLETALCGEAKSFWRPRGYLRITRRAALGYDLCDQLGDGLGDLGRILDDFTESLQSWSRNWRDRIEKNGECGSSFNSALLALLQSVDAIRLAHEDVLDVIKNQVLVQLKDWQKVNYRRNVIGQIKEATSMEADFAANQKPWNKLNKAQQKSKKKHFELSKKVINARHQETVSQHDTSRSPDQLEEMRVRIQTLEQERVHAEQAYRQNMEKLEAHQGRYIGNMEKVYERADAMETCRLNFFRFLLDKSRGALNKITYGPGYQRMNQTFASLETSISMIRVDDDLASYRSKFGTGMASELPPFEEYTDSLHQLLRGQKLSKKLSRTSVHGGGLSGLKSLSSLNPFKSNSSSMLPSAVEDNDGQASIDVLTPIRYFVHESPRGFASPRVDANNNTDDGAGSDDDDDDDLSDTSGVDENDRFDAVDAGEMSNAVSLNRMKKSVSFEAVVQELNQRQERSEGFNRQNNEPLHKIATTSETAIPQESDENSVAEIQRSAAAAEASVNLAVEEAHQTAPINADPEAERQQQVAATSPPNISVIPPTAEKVKGHRRNLSGSSVASDIPRPSPRLNRRNATKSGQQRQASNNPSDAPHKPSHVLNESSHASNESSQASNKPLHASNETLPSSNESLSPDPNSHSNETIEQVFEGSSGDEDIQGSDGDNFQRASCDNTIRGSIDNTIQGSSGNAIQGSGIDNLTNGKPPLYPRPPRFAVAIAAADSLPRIDHRNQDGVTDNGVADGEEEDREPDRGAKDGPNCTAEADSCVIFGGVADGGMEASVSKRCAKSDGVAEVA